MATTFEYQTDTSDMLIPHNMFRSALSSASDIIDRVRADDEAQAAVVTSYLDNILRFLDAHHGGEDAIVWPLLTERCSDEAALIARMEGQHEGIHELRARVETALTAWSQSPDAEHGTKLADALTGLHRELDVHFGEEEREILPLASRNMSPEEWGGLPGHAMGHFTGDKIWLVLGLILEQMTEEQRQTTLKLLPQPAIDMWTGMGSAAFDDFIARVRQTDRSPIA